jgi:hypothetical protein
MSGLPTRDQTIRPGDDSVNGVRQVRETFFYLGRVNAVDTTLLARACFVHSLTMSNPTATAFEVFLADATTVTGTVSDGSAPRFNVPANSCITHVVDRQHFTGVRVRGAAAFPSGAEISATGV